MSKRQKKTRKIAFLGLFTAIAMILSYVEAVSPVLISAIPGIKMGLPNVAIIFVLYRFGEWEAALVSAVRVLAVSILFGSPVTFIYSIAGALASLGVMILLKKLFTKSQISFLLLKLQPKSTLSISASDFCSFTFEFCFLRRKLSGFEPLNL